MAEPLADELLLLEEGVLMCEVMLKSNVIVVTPVMCCLCDNPHAAQICV